jgi:hypothetical protein
LRREGDVEIGICHEQIIDRAISHYAGACDQVGHLITGWLHLGQSFHDLPLDRWPQSTDLLKLIEFDR